MKKFIAGIFTLIIAVCALVGCGEMESEEERFLKAQQKFDNFTVTLDFKVQGEEEYRAKFEFDKKACKYIITEESSIRTYYYKETDSGVYYYINKSYGWQPTIFDTMNEIRANGEVGYVAFFEKFFYDDFEKDGDYLKMTDSALASYSALLGSYATLDSAKLKLNGSHFSEAVAIIQSGSARTQIEYKFEKYGTTSVNLPE